MGIYLTMHFNDNTSNNNNTIPSSNLGVYSVQNYICIYIFVYIYIYNIYIYIYIYIYMIHIHV